MGLEWISLAAGFVREAVDVYYEWEGRKAVPMKIKELLIVLQIEVDKLQAKRPSPRFGET